MRFKIRASVVLAGHSVLSLKWKVNILYSRENYLNFPSSNALIVTQIQWDVPVAGKIIACTTFRTTAESVCGKTTPTPRTTTCV